MTVREVLIPGRPVETESVAKATHEFGDTEDCFGLPLLKTHRILNYIYFSKYLLHLKYIPKLTKAQCPRKKFLI